MLTKVIINKARNRFLWDGETTVLDSLNPAKRLPITQVFKHIGAFNCKQKATTIAKLSHAIVKAEYSAYHWENIGNV
jgi:hypothetical protein